MEKISIYILSDPRDKFFNPKYVGITCRKLKSRLASHMTPSTLKHVNHRTNWIKFIIGLGLIPNIELIEETTDWDSAYAREKVWIEYFTNKGFNLINSTDGGKGTHGLKLTEEHINKIRQSKIGTTLSKEHKNKISMSLMDSELRLRASKRGKANIHKLLSDPNRGAKISTGLKNYKRTQQHLDNAAAGRRIKLNVGIKFINNITNESILFDSIKDFMEYSNLSYGQIYRWAKNGYNKKFLNYSILKIKNI